MLRTILIILIVLLAGYVAYRALAPEAGIEQELPGVDVETDEIDVYEREPTGPKLEAGETDVDVVEEGAPEAPPDPDVGMDPEDQVLEDEPERLEPEEEDAIDPEDEEEEDPVEEEPPLDAAGEDEPQR